MSYVCHCKCKHDFYFSNLLIEVVFMETKLTMTEPKQQFNGAKMSNCVLKLCWIFQSRFVFIKHLHQVRFYPCLRFWYASPHINPYYLIPCILCCFKIHLNLRKRILCYFLSWLMFLISNLQYHLDFKHNLR